MNSINDPGTATEDYPVNFNLKNIPLTALRQKTKILLSKQLNPTKILLSEEGYPRDWRGIAHLAGIQNFHGTIITNNSDPMTKVLQTWCKENPDNNPTFNKLLQFLGLIDRWDVADDIKDSLVEDAKFYLKNKHQQSLENTTTISSPPPIVKSDSNILTIDDVSRSRQGLSPQHYDGFVLFADEDIDFATELIERMEDCGFKLCVKERDLIGGVSFEHEAILRLISERCNRLIVIVSPAFLKSGANTFFVNFAQALGIEQGRRKIVPCLYERCDLPPTLNFYFLLNYQRSGRLWNFWEKLKDSIKSTPIELNERNINSIPSIQITEVDSSESLPTIPRLQIELPEDNKTISTPIKIPRSKKDKRRISASQDLPSPTDSFNSSIGSMNLSQASTNSLQSERHQIMPPRPRARNASSMVDLTSAISPTDSVLLNCDISQSNSALNAPIEKTSEIAQKKLKWYKKLLSPSSTDIQVKEKTKKKWFRKKVTSLNA